MTLYLKYRPQKIEELDLEEVKETLKKIVAAGSIPHAFLFSGPKGTGKTSAARILAKIVNCESTSSKLRGPKKIEPCNKCSQCMSISKGENLDVIEIDAASHRGIDDVRALRDAAKLAPARSKKKVYIIDEAHMLTTEASNALLKTLEEPPSHVMFILATTNPEKLIGTIRSRCVNILFKKASSVEIVASLKRKIRGEKLNADEGSLESIARAANGSFRDADKILEQLIAEKVKLEKSEVEAALFKKGGASIENLLEFLERRDAKGSLSEIEKAVEAGISMENYIEMLLGSLHKSLLAKSGLGKDDLVNFSKEEIIKLIGLTTRAYSELKLAYIEQIPLEIAVVAWCERGMKGPVPKIDKLIATNKPKETQETENEKVKELDESTITKNYIDEAKPLTSNNQNSGGVDDGIWSKILSAVKPRNTSVEALLRAAKPIDYDGKTLTLGVFYRFHKERLEEGHHRRILEEVVETIFGNPVRIVCTLTEPPIKKVVNEEESKSSVQGGNTVLTEPDSASATSDAVLTEPEDEDIITIVKEIFGS